MRTITIKKRKHIAIFKNNKKRIFIDKVIDVDILKIIFFIKKKSVLLISLFLIGYFLALIFFENCISPLYESTSKMYILTTDESALNLEDVKVYSKLKNDYIELIKNKKTIEKIIKELNLDYTYDSLSSAIQVTNPADTRIIAITVKTTIPQLSADIANKLALYGQQGIAEIIRSSKPVIYEEAIPSSKKVSPKSFLNSLLVGMVFVMVYCFICVLRSTRYNIIRNSEDVYDAVGMIPIVEIPEMKSSNN